MATKAESLPNLRFSVSEAIEILRLSRATFYDRVKQGEIALAKDGRRSFVTAGELSRYVQSKSP
jgi:excisionase family DNA binding protein